MKIKFYTKANCSLCDEAKKEIDPILKKFRLQLEEIDITKDDQIFERFKDLIPVGELDGEILFVYRIDRKKIIKKLKQRFRKFLF